MFCTDENRFKRNCSCDERKPVIATTITIQYGPYLSWGIIRHRTERLQCLIETMQEMGHTVILVPTAFFDRLELYIKGKLIFRGKITNFEINPIDIKDDPACLEALRAVANTITKIARNMNMSN